MIQTVIIEDNNIHAEHLDKCLQAINVFNVIGLFSDFDTFIQKRNELSADIYFIDVELADKNVLDYKELKDLAGKIVFTTSHSKFALKSYDFNALHYLVKPVSQDNLLDVLNRYYSKTEKPKSSVYLKLGTNEFIKIDLKEILYIEGYGDYIKVHLNSKTILSYLTLKEFENQIGHPSFIRIHRSYIANADNIYNVVDDTVNFNNGSDIPVGGKYKQNLFSLIQSSAIVRK